ncbi:hypothetical protein BO71DRAFT_200871 [Aspergillus ellipticus CBS 707.79]|uniref:Uncharacterized protein n=1 Tax=Aspergillus ellipticus CBS 707.79 TaxID=1448320 RepID=A0A319EVS4_9EURO|nr:hypothetical protein BO71DRAFT_200871 [Aspergillus ellipticus CBS 707.79]
MVGTATPCLRSLDVLDCYLDLTAVSLTVGVICPFLLPPPHVAHLQQSRLEAAVAHRDRGAGIGRVWGSASHSQIIPAGVPPWPPMGATDPSVAIFVVGPRERDLACRVCSSLPLITLIRW